ncbi:MAG: hypothetical protein Q7V63_02335 [Gammaproteobacteria bacterium]|nr:hypothetical protein [Gammaproteobacteria bacterium]
MLAGAGVEAWTAKQGLRKLLDINVIVYGIGNTIKPLGSQVTSSAKFKKIIAQNPSQSAFTADEIKQIQDTAESHYKPSFSNSLKQRDPRQKLRLTFLSKLTLSNQHYLLSEPITHWLETLAQAPDDNTKFNTIKNLEVFFNSFKRETFPASEEDLLHALIKEKEGNLLHSYLKSLSEPRRKEILAKEDSKGVNLLSYTFVNEPTIRPFVLNEAWERKYAEPSCVSVLCKCGAKASTIGPLLNKICGFHFRSLEGWCENSGYAWFGGTLTLDEKTDKYYIIVMLERLFYRILGKNIDSLFSLEGNKLWLANGAINKEFIITEVLETAFKNNSLSFLKEAINEAGDDIFGYRLGSPSYPILSHIALSHDIRKAEVILQFKETYEALARINEGKAKASLKTAFQDAINANHANAIHYLMSHFSTILLSIAPELCARQQDELTAVKTAGPSAPPLSPAFTDEPTSQAQATSVASAEKAPIAQAPDTSSRERAIPAPRIFSLPAITDEHISLTPAAPVASAEKAPTAQVPDTSPRERAFPATRVFSLEEFPAVPTGPIEISTARQASARSLEPEPAS